MKMTKRPIDIKINQKEIILIGTIEICSVINVKEIEAQVM
jgi:hypothetical protein